jgi:DNA helicase-2/ATP-dependent DNA helicase PcrA
VAPAGFGKTHLIAEALKHTPARDLILTHTYAGVNALRNKLRALGVSSRSYRIDTIAAWALRLCLSYPQNADWTIEEPEGAQWRDLYLRCASLLGLPFVKRILRASYSAVYVDEYQDCAASQHELVLRLADTLPIRLLGDPLQGIFDFTAEAAVDWSLHVTPHFEQLGALDTPWRWRNVGADALGQWLTAVRHQLEAGAPISLDELPTGVADVHLCTSDEDLRNNQITICKYFDLPAGQTVVGIHKGDSHHKAKCQKLAKNTGGRFSSIEEIEGKRMFAFVKAYDRNISAQDKLLCAIEFAKTKCMSAVDNALCAGTKRGEAVGIKNNTKNPAVAAAANDYLADPRPDRLAAFFALLKQAPETQIYARDLLNRVMRVLANCEPRAETTLAKSAKAFQSEFRHTGRPLRYSKLLGTTLLLKGLEFDHAIVLDAGSLSTKDLYVALTRGSRSLTIVSQTNVLNSTVAPED